MPFVQTVPVFKLYGEECGWPTPDLLHCESILQRSSLYQWHIRVHQHAEMVQLLYLHQGRAEIEIEGATEVMTESCIQVVPALCIHGFNFFTRDARVCASLALPLLSRFENQFGRPLDVLSVPQCAGGPFSRAHAYAVFSASRGVLRRARCARNDALFAAGDAVGLAEPTVPSRVPAEDKAERKRSMMRHFARLIESHYRQHLPLAEYAKLIGLSVTHLNYLCREFYGCSALGVLHQRLMLEARRNLQYTRMTITQL